MSKQYKKNINIYVNLCVLLFFTSSMSSLDPVPCKSMHSCLVLLTFSHIAYFVILCDNQHIAFEKACFWFDLAAYSTIWCVTNWKWDFYDFIKELISSCSFSIKASFLGEINYVLSTHCSSQLWIFPAPPKFPWSFLLFPWLMHCLPSLSIKVGNQVLINLFFRLIRL